MTDVQWSTNTSDWQIIEESNVIVTNDDSDSDLNIGDEEGNVIAQFSEGHFKTKNFNSRRTCTIFNDDSDSDLNIGDDEGNVIAQFSEGHFKTKNFNSRRTCTIFNDDSDSDLNIGDDEGNVIAQFSGGHIKTKNFDSRTGSSGSSEGAQWNGKKWFAYGTSLTAEGTGKYQKYLPALSGMTLTNFGIGGGGICTNTAVKTAVMRTTDGKQNADLITLEICANDVRSPLGDIYDTVDNTFCGALNQCIRYLQQNTNAQIVVMSSTTQKRGSDGTPREPDYNYDTSGGETRTWYDICEAMRKVCGLNSCIYIPLCEGSGLGWARMNNALGVNYIIDNIHHTELGGYNLAQFIWSKLKNIPLWYSSIPI